MRGRLGPEACSDINFHCHATIRHMAPHALLIRLFLFTKQHHHNACFHWPIFSPCRRHVRRAVGEETCWYAAVTFRYRFSLSPAFFAFMPSFTVLYMRRERRKHILTTSSRAAMPDIRSALKSRRPPPPFLFPSVGGSGFQLRFPSNTWSSSADILKQVLLHYIIDDMSPSETYSFATGFHAAAGIYFRRYIFPSFQNRNQRKFFFLFFIAHIYIWTMSEIIIEE